MISDKKARAVEDMMLRAVHTDVVLLCHILKYFDRAYAGFFFDILNDLSAFFFKRQIDHLFLPFAPKVGCIEILSNAVVLLLRQHRIKSERKCFDCFIGKVDLIARAVLMEKACGRVDPDIAHILVSFIIVLEIPRLKGFYQLAPDLCVFGVERMTDDARLSAESVHLPTAKGHIRIRGDLCRFTRQLVGHDIEALPIEVGIDKPRGRDIISAR